MSASSQIRFLWTACVLLLGFSGLLLSLHVWDLRLWGDGSIEYERFGTWSDAISGFGTMLGVLAALGALLIERAASRRRQLEQIVEKETGVYIWFSSQVLRDESTGDLRGTIWDLRVENLTRAPIYDWRVELGDGLGGRDSSGEGPLIPGERLFNVPELDDVEPRDCPVPEIHFSTRSQGRWRRSGNGTLEEVPCQSEAVEQQSV